MSDFHGNAKAPSGPSRFFWPHLDPSPLGEGLYSASLQARRLQGSPPYCRVHDTWGKVKTFRIRDAKVLLPREKD